MFTPLEGLAMNLFYFFAISLHQIAYMRSVVVLQTIFDMLVFCAFNIIESYLHYQFELRSFYSMTTANKTSIQYIKFVNRLLPTHVDFADADPRKQDFDEQQE